MKKEDFLKPENRTLFIRKANDLFNKGDYDNAEKLFILTAYIDGLIRLGDHYFYKEHNVLKALELYKASKYQKKISEAAFSLAEILKTWIRSK